MFVATGEVAGLHLHAEVAVEIDREAHGCVGIIDTLELIAIDAAIEGVEVAVTAVQVDA